MDFFKLLAVVFGFSAMINGGLRGKKQGIKMGKIHGGFEINGQVVHPRLLLFFYEFKSFSSPLSCN